MEKELLYKLCVDVFKKTNWESENLFYINWRDEFLNVNVSRSKSDALWKNNAPLYTTDYLLTMLPYKIDTPHEISTKRRFLTLSKSSSSYIARYGESKDPLYSCKGESHTMSLLKLTLELHNAGKLH